MQEYKISEIKNLHVFGRTNKKLDPLTLFWTASGIELNVKASELWVEVEADFEQYEPWVSFVVDKVQIGRQMLQKGKVWLPVFRGLDKTVKRNVRIMRDMQAMSGDLKCSLKLHGIRIDGTIEKLEDKSCKIEFIGDSITSGEGLNGAKNEMDWVSMVFSSVKGYTTMIADELNADYHVISQSGWGVLSSWDGNPNFNIPKYYKQTCGLLQGESQIEDGAKENYDFKSWQPDVVVINLGTNDASAFIQPSIFKDDVTGELFDQKVNEDGSFEEDSVKRFENAVIDFVKDVRTCNPLAQIVWAYGMLGNPIEKELKEAIESYKSDSEDDKVYYVSLEASTEETVGSREHPGVKCHIQAVEKLVPILQKLIQEK